MGSLMIERKEKQKKGIISSEDDISTLLERYQAFLFLISYSVVCTPYYGILVIFPSVFCLWFIVIAEFVYYTSRNWMPLMRAVFGLWGRYSVRTILTLLREVAQVSEVRIDWDKLVKNSSTGISNAREYQMLWRHLAYRHTLLENMDCLTGPLVSVAVCLSDMAIPLFLSTNLWT